jgi:hypothetical protein
LSSEGRIKSQAAQLTPLAPDGDFRSLVEAVQPTRCARHGDLEHTQPPMLADELRRQADVFTDLPVDSDAQDVISDARAVRRRRARSEE